MVVFLGVFDVVRHSVAVDSPVASWTVLDGLRQVGFVFCHVGKDHLEP